VRNLIWLLVLASAAGCAVEAPAPAENAPVLPSWNDGPARQSIIDFVERTTTPGSADFVEPEDRIATFDNDGTLWSEQPMYFQLLFAIDRIHMMAADHPEWNDQQPFKAVLENDNEALIASGEHGLMQLLMASHAGMSTDEFAQIVSDWLGKARHPRFDRPYSELVYQPMLEVLDYLRANGFQTWIVSGGGIEFMRVFAQEVYGVGPQQVIGSSIELEYEMRDDGPVLVRQPALHFLNDKGDKPVAIERFIGRRPIAAFGNSDGDLQMLQWTAAGDGPRFGLIVHHTDSEREWAYDRDSHIGRLDQALVEAAERGWTVVDMERDWATIYPASQ